MQTTECARRSVYGPIQRVLHWWLALAAVGLAVTGMIAQWGLDVGRERIMLVEAHAHLGIAFSIGLALRLLWAVIGPEPARLSAFWRAAKGMSRVLRGMGSPFGYEPQGAAAYLGLYTSMLVSAASGLALAAIRYDFGPLSEPLFDDFSRHALFLVSHDISSYLIIAFVPAHIIGMMRHERTSGTPVAQAMLSGYKYEPSGERSSP